MVQYLHITYTQIPVYFKLSLDCLQYLIKCENHISTIKVLSKQLLAQCKFKFCFLFMYYFWLCWVYVAFAWAFSSCDKQWLLSVAMCRLFIAVASLVAEHRPQAHSLQQLKLAGLVAPWHIDCFRTRDRSMSPVLTGRFLSTAPSGKSSFAFLELSEKLTLMPLNLGIFSLI